MSLTRHGTRAGRQAGTHNSVERYPRARESARPITISGRQQKAPPFFSLVSSNDERERERERERESSENSALVRLSNPSRSHRGFLLGCCCAAHGDVMDSLFESPYVMRGILVAGHVSLRWAARR